MTGTEGWVTFRTTNLRGTPEFFKVTHCLPLIGGPRRGAHVETMRFNPTIESETTEFDTRDTLPATISIKRSQTTPHDFLMEFQSVNNNTLLDDSLTQYRLKGVPLLKPEQVERRLGQR